MITILFIYSLLLTCLYAQPANHTDTAPGGMMDQSNRVPVTSMVNLKGIQPLAGTVGTGNLGPRLQAQTLETIQNAVQSAVQAAVPGAVQAAVQAALPSVLQSAVHAAAPQTRPTAGVPTQTTEIQACSGSCPPSWIAQIRGFIGIIKANDPLCKFQYLMAPCDQPNTQNKCQQGFSCCPISCLESIKDCHQGPPIQNMCVPDDITPWWSDMTQTYMQSKGLGMFGGMGGAMGGMGGMGMLSGMMGGMGGMMGGEMPFKKK